MNNEGYRVVGDVRNTDMGMTPSGLVYIPG